MIIPMRSHHVDYVHALHDLRMFLLDREQARARLEAANLADMPTLLQQSCGYELPAAFAKCYHEAVAAQDWATVRGVLAQAGDVLRRSVVRRSLAEQARLGMCEILAAICGDCAAACGPADLLAQCQRRG